MSTRNKKSSETWSPQTSMVQRTKLEAFLARAEEFWSFMLVEAYRSQNTFL